jgi:Pectinacetylesterase
MKLSSSSLARVLGLAVVAALASTQACGGDSNNNSGGSSASSSSAAGGAGTGGTASGAGGSGGSANGGGGGGVGGFDAPNEKWTYIPVEGAKCMNGTDTGIGVNLENGSNDVLIYMEGGNACFNTGSCAITYNKDGYGPTQFDMEVTKYLGAPVFDRTSSFFKKYNFVYIPYCTGDVHAGDNDTEVAGTMRHFHGAHNMDLYLARMQAAFPHAKHVIVSGSSAGGFGAAVNYDRTAKAFPGVKVSLIDDSGPPMAEEFVSACLQRKFKDIWGLDKTLPAGCPDCKNNDAFMEPLIKYITTTYSNQRLSVISSSQDGTISLFWAYGQEPNGTADCCNIDPNSTKLICPIGDSSPVCTGDNPYPGLEYAEGLYNLRETLVGASNPNFKAFIIDGTNGEDDTHHVWLDHDPTMVLSNDVTLETFLEDQINESPGWANVGLPADPGWMPTTGAGGGGGASACGGGGP